HNVNLYKGKKRRKMRHKEQKDHSMCGTCHNAHNGKGPYIMSRSQEDRKANQTAINALCIDCHRKGGSASNSKTGKHSHPVGVQLNDAMSKSKLPLFNKAGERVKAGTDGLLDCVTCHNVHQWDASNRFNKHGKNIKRSGNGSNSFLRIKASGSSSLCVNCHKNEARVLGTDHDMRVTAKNSRNRKKQKVNQSGVCGQCHSAHNSSVSATLWARSLGEADNKQEAFCRSCHNSNGIAKKNPVGKATHPPEVLVWSSTVRAMSGRNQGADMPVYTKNGHKHDVGMITCTTCHDPHTWQASNKKKGSGKPVEGSVINSFLRAESTRKTVCSDCHGLDAIFRYQYFHAETSRKEHPLFR
ncbi:MAG: hypothetical protein GXP13_03985, partial [Gammaproteobacteria bacterium]|nr:hypothetical protein [Gammaproteobacteria bacterium]